MDNPYESLVLMAELFVEFTEKRGEITAKRDKGALSMDESEQSLDTIYDEFSDKLKQLHDRVKDKAMEKRKRLQSALRSANMKRVWAERKHRMADYLIWGAEINRLKGKLAELEG